jgi:hypothetical protein
LGRRRFFRLGKPVLPVGVDALDQLGEIIPGLRVYFKSSLISDLTIRFETLENKNLIL